MAHILLEYNSFKRESQNLSGIALLVDDKICLVLPKKFKEKKKYSIPKGHIEPQYKNNPFYNAYLELREETGIDIGITTPDQQFNYNYKKNGVNKRLNVYIIKISGDEYAKLKKYDRNRKEIKKVKFVNKAKALELVEIKFKKLIRYIYK
jgi:8-oxo-dGTP pyrophosphatase MutT (NUDIX family)